MNQNMGSTDRMIRLIVLAIIVVLYFTNSISGVFATILLVIAAILLVTRFFSFCPLYLPFGISTRNKSEL